MDIASKIQSKFDKFCDENERENMTTNENDQKYTAYDLDPERPDVTFQNSTHIHIANALYLWEGGDFSDAVEAAGGLPIIIGDTECGDWDDVENALANFPDGPYDPRELDD